MSDVPAPEVLSEAANLEIFDVNGGKVSFGSLFESEKAVIVFIRLVHASTSAYPYTHYFPSPRAFLLRCTHIFEDNAELRTDICGTNLKY